MGGAGTGDQERLRTSDVAAASGYSVQQVRDLERLGVLPPTRRAANGYRRFGPRHLHALGVYRQLAVALGPVPARRVLREVQGLPLERAAAQVASLHVALAREREQALAAQHALLAIRDEAGTDRAPQEDTLSIGQLAAALDVRTSTLRFWEQVGLLRPERIGSLAVRSYPSPAVRDARVVAALRAAGYRIPEVAQTMDSLRALEDPSRPLASLTDRLDGIARRTLALLEAGTGIVALLTGPTPTDPTDTPAPPA